MSQADKLLDSVAVASVDTATEGYIVVGEDRFITVPDDLKKIGVQYDHDIETVTFQCPRYWDNHDILQHKIYVNYMRPDETLGSHLCSNLRVDPSDSTLALFDWTISGHVTEFSGPISFLVCAKVTGTDGLEITHWNSELNTEMFVSAGLKCPDVIVRRNVDIITQLLTRMEVCESNTTPDEILDRINEALDTNETTQKNISDRVDNYLLDHTALNEAVEEKVGEFGEAVNTDVKEFKEAVNTDVNEFKEEVTSYYTDVVIPLLASDWTLNSNTGNYEQSVTVEGINASSTPIIGLSTASEEATEEELAAYACISDVITGENTIKFIASEKPATSITVIAKGTTATHNEVTADVTALTAEVGAIYKPTNQTMFLSDFNDMTTPGRYGITTANYVKTVANCPPYITDNKRAINGYLEVINLGRSPMDATVGYLLQRLVTFNAGQTVYQRVQAQTWSLMGKVTDSSWSEWEMISSNDIAELEENMIVEEVIWENPSNNADFAATTVAVDLTPYTTLRVLYRVIVGSPRLHTETFYCISGADTLPINLYEAKLAMRPTTIAGDKKSIAFESGLMMTYGSNATTHDECMIPARIIGVKQQVRNWPD